MQQHAGVELHSSFTYHEAESRPINISGMLGQALKNYLWSDLS